MIEWQYVFVGGFALAIGGTIGWYVALRRRFTDQSHDNLFARAVSALLILFAIASVGQLFYFQREQTIQADQLRKTTDCQYRVNKALIEVLTIRQDPTQQKDDAILRMVRTILKAKSGDEVQAALTNYVRAVDELNKTRANNPYPTIPGDCRPE